MNDVSMEQDNMSLSYIDFINGASATQWWRKSEKLLGVPVRVLTAAHDCSGPKEDQAIEIFKVGNADFWKNVISSLYKG